MGRMVQLAWSPAGDLLATVQIGSGSGLRVIIWNQNGTFNKRLQMPPMIVELQESFDFDAPKFSNDDSFIIVSYKMPGWIQFHKLDTSTGCLSAVVSTINTPLALGAPRLEWTNDLEFFWQGLHSTINLWRIGQPDGLVPLQNITIPNSLVKEMAFNAKTNTLAYIFHASPFRPFSSVSLWKTDAPDMAVSVLGGNDDHVVRIGWKSNPSDILAALDWDGGVRIWETTSRTPLQQYNAFHPAWDPNFRASFSPDGRFIAGIAVSAQGVDEVAEVKIVKFDTGDTVAVCEALTDAEVMGWSPGGDMLAVNRVNLNVFNVDKINFGMNLKGLSLMRVASLLEENLVNGKDEAREFLENKIPKDLMDDVLKYLI